MRKFEEERIKRAEEERRKEGSRVLAESAIAGAHNTADAGIGAGHPRQTYALDQNFIRDLEKSLGDNDSKSYFFLDSICHFINSFHHTLSFQTMFVFSTITKE